MRYLTTKSVLGLTGGLAAGMAAMYLLDPSAGRRRRSAIASAANYAVHHGGEVVHHAGDTVRDAAVSAGEKIGDLADLARRASEQATSAAQAFAAAAPASPATAAGLRRVVDSYHDSAHYLAERVNQVRQAFDPRSAASHASNLAHASTRLAGQLTHAGQAILTPIVAGAKSTFNRFAPTGRTVAKRSLVLIPITVGGVICVGAGAGAMYFLDPDRGRDRRKGVRDRLFGMVGNIGRFARRRGKNVRNNVEGFSRDIGLTSQRRVSSRGYVSGEQLLLRVRGEIARACRDPRLIQVMTDTFGMVTLTGEIVDSERAPVIAAVRQTPGVRQLVDRLSVQATPGAPAAGQST